jgi:hypothetical protein
MPQGECRSGSTRRGVQEQGAEHSCRSTNADGAVVHDSSGDDVPRLPSNPCIVNQQEVLSLRYNSCGNDTSSNNTWPMVGFLEFGGASASYFQAADVSQFGGTFTDVAQPIDISDFGNASTVIPPSTSHFQVADVSQFGGTFTDVVQPIDISDFGNASTVIPPSTSHFQVADVSQFGGTFTDVAQPIDISDFGNASTVIPPSSVWQVDRT